MNTERFQDALQTVLQGNHIRGGIGTLSEKTVHAVLKNYFNPDINSQETKIGGFTVDIVGANGITEIQTAGFNRLRKKLDVLLSICDVTVVYPIPHNKWIVHVESATGESVKKRKSPKKGNVYSVFRELCMIKEQIKSENFHLCIVLFDVEEYRIPPVKGRYNRKGYSLYDRIPVSLHDEIHIDCVNDWLYFIPSELLKGEFISADFAAEAGIPVHLAQTALYVLSEVGAVVRVGKRGRSILYSVGE